MATPPVSPPPTFTIQTEPEVVLLFVGIAFTIVLAVGAAILFYRASKSEREAGNDQKSHHD